MTDTPHPEPAAAEAAAPAVAVGLPVSVADGTPALVRAEVAVARHPAALALAVGALAGGVARLLYLALPDPWGTLANTSALWGLVPFFTVAALRVRGRRAVLGGITSLTAMVAVWVLLAPVPPTSRELGLWGVVGVAAGALCGLAGSLLSRPEAGLRRSAAAALGGVVLGEGVYGILLIGGPQWWLEAVVGVLLATLRGPTTRDRVTALAGAVLAAAALFGVFAAYDAIAAG